MDHYFTVIVRINRQETERHTFYDKSEALIAFERLLAVHGLLQHNSNCYECQDRLYCCVWPKKGCYPDVTLEECGIRPCS